MTELRKVSKPILIAANKIDIDDAKENFEILKHRYNILPCSAESELALKEAAHHCLIQYIPGGKDFTISSDKITEKQKIALDFIRKSILERMGSTGVQSILNSMVFDFLGYIVVYPVANITHTSDKKGNVLPDALIIKKGTTLKDFAAKIHSDMADKFIGGIDHETKKKIGAEHILKDGDIVEVIFSR